MKTCYLVLVLALAGCGGGDCPECGEKGSCSGVELSDDWYCETTTMHVYDVGCGDRYFVYTDLAKFCPNICSGCLEEVMEMFDCANEKIIDDTTCDACKEKKINYGACADVLCGQ